MNAREIKNKTSERFSNWAGKYDRSLLQRLVFRNSHDMFISEIVPHSAKLVPAKAGNRLRVLDVGCGTGEFMSRLSACSDMIALDGVDISPDMVKLAASKFENKNAAVKVGDVEELPYEDGLFDVITCSHSFHHYPDQEKAVSEMHRVLKRDGRLLMIDGSRDKVLGKVIFGLFIKGIEKNVYHILAAELREILTMKGFKEITQRVFNPFVPLLFTIGTKG